MPRTATTKRATRGRPATKRKTTAKKTTVGRKSTARKTAAAQTTRKAVKAKTKQVTTPIKEKLSKSQLHALIAENTGISKKEVTTVLDELHNVIERSVKKRGLGEFTLPGMCKVVVNRKPATKARKGINPFTGEPTTFKAKPARNVVKIRALKKLKEAVN